MPQVVCYKANWFFYQLGKRVLAVPFISLVNLIAGREVVRELIVDFTLENTVAELRAILPGGARRAGQLAGYAEVQQKIGQAGASARAGRRMVELVRQMAGVAEAAD